MKSKHSTEAKRTIDELTLVVYPVFVNWLHLLLIGSALLFWEILDPLRPIDYRKDLRQTVPIVGIVIIFDLIVACVLILGINKLIPSSILDVIDNTGIYSLPLWLRIIVGYLLLDFLKYWFHRALHTFKYLWLTHKWHHSIEEVWWLSGKRESLLNEFFRNIPILALALFDLPAEILAMMAIHSRFQRNWIHLNIRWQPWMQIVEWVCVTPRIHMIHHCANPQLQGSNLGTMFTFWDRIFGTYVSPEMVDIYQEQSGLVEERVTIKTMFGI